MAGAREGLTGVDYDNEHDSGVQEDHMRIASIETFFVRPRWMFLRVETDTGIVGWGEPIVEGRARTVATAIRELEPHLLGSDPRRIEHHWQTIYRGTFYRGGPVLVSALSGVEQALWDIKGKALGVPVHELLGGACRERIRMYAHCGGNTPEQAAESVRRRVDQGFTAVKTGVPAPIRTVDTPAVVEGTAASVAAMREAVGAGIDIGIDFHGRVSPAMAIRLARALEPSCPMFIEEPCLPENVDTLARVAQSTSIPVATGERLFTRWGFREVLEKQAAAILQPDLCHCGGIFEARKIAAMAEVYYAAMAPHNPLGPISLAACLQLDACIPNFLLQEHPGMADGWDLGQGYLTSPFVVDQGYIAVPEAPGLGVEVDEAVVRERQYDGSWDTPHLTHPDDGSVADW